MNIDSFKDAVGGGVRNALFRVNGFIGNQGSDNARIIFMHCCSVTCLNDWSNNLPHFRGRNIKIPTSRTFEDWTITILSDRGMVLRSKFEQWVDSINGSRDNVEQVQDAVTNFHATFTDWYVDQLDRSGKAIKSYQFKYCFPTSIGSVDLNAADEELSILQSVTLAYSYFLTTGVSTGGNAGALVSRRAVTPATE